MTTGATNERKPEQARPPREEWETRDQVPLLPSRDPFYQPPVDFRTLPAGAVLRWRRVDLALFGRVRQHVDAWQLLYRTNSMHHEPEAAVTTVVLPARVRAPAHRPLLAYQCAIDAVADKCFPSYALRYGSRAIGAVPQFEWPLIAAAVARGWAVSISDHEGQDGCFVAPREPGYRILDGVRAAMSFEPIGLDRSTPVGIWGYSGGGMASSWAAEMAPAYAPEIGIVGAVLGAPVSDPGQLAVRLNGTAFSGLTAIGIASLRRCYAGLDARINAHIDAEGQQILAAASQLDTVRAGARFAKQDFNNHCDISLAELLTQPEIVEVFDDVRLGTARARVPDAGHTPSARSDHRRARRRRSGSALSRADGHVSYVRDHCSKHISLMLLSAPLALNWLKNRFRGTGTSNAQNIPVFSIALSAKVIRGYLSILATMLRAVLARPLGPTTARSQHRI